MSTERGTEGLAADMDRDVLADMLDDLVISVDHPMYGPDDVSESRARIMAAFDRLTAEIERLKRDLPLWVSEKIVALTAEIERKDAALRELDQYVEARQTTLREMYEDAEGVSDRTATRARIAEVQTFDRRLGRALTRKGETDGE